jgi:hypothetical protein
MNPDESRHRSNPEKELFVLLRAGGSGGIMPDL